MTFPRTRHYGPLRAVYRADSVELAIRIGSTRVCVEMPLHREPYNELCRFSEDLDEAIKGRLP